MTLDISKLIDYVREDLKTMSVKVDKIGGRVERIDVRLEKVEEKVNCIDGKFDKIGSGCSSNDGSDNSGLSIWIKLKSVKLKLKLNKKQITALGAFTASVAAAILKYYGVW